MSLDGVGLFFEQTFNALNPAAFTANSDLNLLASARKSLAVAVGIIPLGIKERV